MRPQLFAERLVKARAKQKDSFRCLPVKTVTLQSYRYGTAVRPGVRGTEGGEGFSTGREPPQKGCRQETPSGGGVRSYASSKATR